MHSHFESTKAWVVQFPHVVRSSNVAILERQVRLPWVTWAPIYNHGVADTLRIEAQAVDALRNLVCNLYILLFSIPGVELAAFVQLVMLNLNSHIHVGSHGIEGGKATQSSRESAGRQN